MTSDEAECVAEEFISALGAERLADGDVQGADLADFINGAIEPGGIGVAVDESLAMRLAGAELNRPISRLLSPT
jgi:hypothetical protein